MSTDLFCEIIAGERPATVVHEDEVAVSFLDTRPVFKGHVLVVPRNPKDGLRGFFWPRTKYASPEEARDYAGRVAGALTAG